MATNPERQSWRLIDVLKEATGYLNARGIKNSRLNAERLLANSLNTSRMDLYLQFEKPLRPEERESYKTLLRRRANHEPLQYILGETEFMSLNFELNSHVLVPRPETETLVEQAIQFGQTKFKNKDKLNILEIGTGSGCIAVSLAKYLLNAFILSIDRNDEALQIAKKNAHKNDVSERIHFKNMDIMKQTECPENKLFNIIVSNPPYIKESDLALLAPEIRDFEPMEALDGGMDGLDFYRRFQKILPDWLDDKGLAIFEIGADQGKAVQEIFDTEPWETVRIIQDLAGLDRVAMLTKTL